MFAGNLFTQHWCIDSGFLHMSEKTSQFPETALQVAARVVQSTQPAHLPACQSSCGDAFIAKCLSNACFSFATSEESGQTSVLLSFLSFPGSTSLSLGISLSLYISLNLSFLGRALSLSLCLSVSLSLSIYLSLPFFFFFLSLSLLCLSLSIFLLRDLTLSLFLSGSLFHCVFWLFMFAPSRDPQVRTSSTKCFCPEPAGWHAFGLVRAWTDLIRVIEKVVLETVLLSSAEKLVFSTRIGEHPGIAFAQKHWGLYSSDPGNRRK